MTYPEWGLATRSTASVGATIPISSQQMANWIRTNNVAYASYFEEELGDGGAA